MRHLVNIIALLAGVLAALAVCGCATSGGGTRTGPGIGVAADLSLPWPEKSPVCIPEGACIAAPNDSWRILGPCNGQPAVDPMMLVPMRVDTFNRMMFGAALKKAASERRPHPVQVDTPEEANGEYPKIIRRIVTEYENGIPVDPADAE